MESYSDLEEVSEWGRLSNASLRFADFGSRPVAESVATSRYVSVLG